MQENKIREALVELLYRNSYGVVVANILISLAAAYVLCAGQRMNQEGSSPSGARMRGAVSKSGGNSSLAGRARRYGEV